MRLSQFYDPSSGFNRLTRVDLVFLVFFFKFHSSTLGWLRVVLHNLFWFSFYGVILRARLRILLVNPCQIELLWICFLWGYPGVMTQGHLLCWLRTFFKKQFIIQHCVDWELSFIIYFNLLYMGLSQSYDLSNDFDRLS